MPKVSSAEALFEQGADADGDPDPERLESFVEQNMKFMEDCTERGLVFLKATLHLDEHTPHIHAIAVPLDENGQLNCKRHFGGTRARMREWQDEYYSYMQPLGLERGIKGSKAVHQEVAKFYATIRDEVRLEVKVEQLPDPPPAHKMVTKAQRDEYKQRLASEIITQLGPKYETMRKQALLTNDEHHRRTSAERRLAEVEAGLGERVQGQVKEQVNELKRRMEVEHENRLRETTEGLRNKIQERRQNEMRLAHELVNTERGLRQYRQELGRLQAETGTLTERVSTLSQANEQLAARAQKYHDQIGIDGFLQAEGLLVSSDPQDGVTRYVLDPNRDFTDIGLTLRPEARAPLSIVYTRVDETGEVFHDHTGECAGTTTWEVADDYYQRTGRSGCPQETLELLAERFGEEAAAGCYLAYCDRQATAMLGQARSLVQTRAFDNDLPAPDLSNDWGIE